MGPWGVAVGVFCVLVAVPHLFPPEMNLSSGVGILSTGVSEPSSGVGTLSLVAEDFRWAENLVFDGEGGLFVSDFIGGSVDKLQRNPSTKAVTRTPWVHSSLLYRRSKTVVQVRDYDLECVLGLAVKKNTRKETASDPHAFQEEEEGPEGFVVYRKDGVDRIASFSTTNTSAGMQNRFELPTMGNGLALHERSGMLYTTEGNAHWVPAKTLLAMNTTAAAAGSGKADEAVHTFDDFLGCDGAFVAQKQNLLFFSNVFRRVRVYDISSSSSSLTKGKLLYQYSAPGMRSLDDFCIVELPSGALVFVGADFSMRKVVAFLACPKEPPSDAYSPPSHLVLASGFGGNPTSVRLGEGAGWQAEKPNEELNLFITEGGPILDTLIGKGLSPIRNRRLYELTVPIAALEGLTQGI